MKNLLLTLLFIGLYAQAAAQVYNRPLSETQTFYIPSDAINNDVVGTVLAYPEFHNAGSAPSFTLKTNVDNIYSVSSTGVITISNNTSLTAGDDVITVTIHKEGYVAYDINVTITCISAASNTFFIDPTSATNGIGTRANPKNAIPDLNSNSGYKYWFKRGTTLTVKSQMAAMGNQTNKYFCSYGQGAKAKIVGNNIRIFSAGSGCSNLRFSELEITAASPAGDGSNWLTQPIYFIDSNGGMEVSHCSISYGLTGIGTGVGTALPGYSLLFNTVHNTEYDGCYINKTTSYTNIIGNYVYSVNWAYQFIGTTETEAGGDCIQFSACDQITARGNYCDHSLFGNKFCIIAEDGSNNRYTAQITDNYCLAPPNNTAIYVQGYITGTKVSRNYTQGGFQGISYGGGGGIIQIDYNVIKSPSSIGIYGGTSNIYNNTLYGCPTAISSHASGYPAKNNLFYFTSSSQIAYNNAGNTNYDYNLFSDEHANMFGSGRSTIAGQTGEDNSVAGNPLFVSATDYHLNLNSPAINKGVDVGLIKDKENVSISGRPNIGAFEFNSDASSPVNPVYQSAVIENASPLLLVMTYDISLANLAPSASAFSVQVNSAARTVNTVVISGTKVTLTLGSAVVYGDNIQVTYTKPGVNPLQTASGAQAASISSQTVLNNVAGVSPAYVSSSIENAAPAILVVNFNLSLANIVPSVSAFSVQVNSAARTVNTVVISGTKVTLTLGSAVVYGDNIQVSYTKPAVNPLQTASGAQAAAISSQTVLNNVAGVSPAYVSSSIENAAPAILVVNYNLSLANIVPSVSAFSVQVNSVARTVNTVVISGTKVTLTLVSAVVYGDNVRISYTKPAVNPLQTTSGAQAASISSQTVLNNVAGTNPAYISSSIENAAPSILVMNYNLSLANIIPAASAFTVNVNSAVRNVSSVTISGTKVLLSLSSTIVYGDAVTIAYAKPASNPLQTSTGAQVLTFANQQVLNNCIDIAPVTSITSPLNNSSFESASNITITASAADPDGTISGVEFYNATTKIGTATSAPYSFTWNNVAAGTYLLTVVATDNMNSKTKSSSVSITVFDTNEPPVVKITNPNKGGDTFKKDATIAIDAIASDPDGAISSVSFFNGSTLLARLTSAPYSFIWKQVAAGTYSITAVATDNSNASTTSDPIDFIVENDPVINPNSEIIKLFPNPSDGHVSVELINPLKNEKSNLVVTDLAGKQIYSSPLSSSESIRQIDLSDKKPGFYILMIMDKQILITKKFIIQ